MNAANYWTQRIHQEIPATANLGFTIEHLDNDSITVTAPLSINRNGHQTGFAGSIFSLGVTCGWVMLSNFLKQQQLDHLRVVAGEASIHYQQPLTEQLSAHTFIDPDSLQTECQDYWDKHKTARHKQKISIGQQAMVAAILDVQYFFVPALPLTVES